MANTKLHPKYWMKVTESGLFCQPANIYIDPLNPVSCAVITHGHADHARPGHETVFATPQTLDIMQTRYGIDMAREAHAMPLRQPIQLGSQSDPVTMTLFPAGHILGSCQVKFTYKGSSIVVSGDYKRSPDPSCEAFEPVSCDVFVTEATFGLPVFIHPPIAQEIQKLLSSVNANPQCCHLVGCYALGKCQRLLLGLRDAGYTETVYLHGALINLCKLYKKHGYSLGEWRPVSDIADKKTLAGKIVLAPPSALNDRWSRKFPNLKTAMASGWMQIRARTKQRKAQIPLVISDHSDWSELLKTISDVDPKEVWVTHGREDALIYQIKKMGYKAKALSLIGYESEEETG